MGCHPSHWRTHIFQDGYCTTNQIHFLGVPNFDPCPHRSFLGCSSEKFDRCFFRWKYTGKPNIRPGSDNGVYHTSYVKETKNKIYKLSLIRIWSGRICNLIMRKKKLCVETYSDFGCLLRLTRKQPWINHWKSPFGWDLPKTGFRCGNIPKGGSELWARNSWHLIYQCCI